MQALRKEYLYEALKYAPPYNFDIGLAIFKADICNTLLTVMEQGNNVRSHPLAKEMLEQLAIAKKKYKHLIGTV